MTFNIEKSTRSLVSVLGMFLALFMVSCEDDAHEEEHIDAEGFILESEGTEIYREFKGTKTGSVTVAVGATLEVSVHFLGDDGKELEHDDHGDETEEEGSLRVSGANSSIATVEVEEHDDGGNHDHEEEMALEITGVSAGSTSFKLELMHDGHADYTSTNNVPITVQ
jgi:hypothetical protein